MDIKENSLQVSNYLSQVACNLEFFHQVLLLLWSTQEDHIFHNADNDFLQYYQTFFFH